MSCLLYTPERICQRLFVAGCGWVAAGQVTGDLLVDFFGDAGEAALAGDGGVHRIALDQQPRPFFILSQDAVVEAALEGADLGDGRLDHEEVVVEGRGLVAAVALGDRQHQAEALDLFIGADPGAHQLGAADLEIAQVVGVIDHATGIGIAVEDADGGGENRLFSHDGAVFPPAGGRRRA